MNRIIVVLVTCLCVLVGAFQLSAQGVQPVPQQQVGMPPSVVVTGRGEAFGRPDRAIVRTGAMAQAAKASDAQRQVNERVTEVVEKLKGLGIPQERIQTVGLTLGPVYAHEERQPGQVEQRIIGYQATNTVQVQLEDLTQIGAVVDAALGAGANQLEGVWFELKDDAAQRREAIKKAVAEAREKAGAIEAATGTQLTGIIEIVEGGVDVVRPMMMQRAMEFAAGADATPIQPGQVRVEATVSIRYRLAGNAGAAPLVR
jgi:uncharacterized protein